jgi:hypothetical protein
MNTGISRFVVRGKRLGCVVAMPARRILQDRFAARLNAQDGHARGGRYSHTDRPEDERDKGGESLHRIGRNVLGLALLGFDVRQHKT